MTPAYDFRGSDSSEILDLNEAPQLDTALWDEELARVHAAYEKARPERLSQGEIEPAPAPVEVVSPTPEYIQQGIDQLQYYANVESERVYMERQVQLAHHLGSIGDHMEAYRDYAKAEVDSAA